MGTGCHDRRPALFAVFMFDASVRMRDGDRTSAKVEVFDTGNIPVHSCKQMNNYPIDKKAFFYNLS
jgi:hypothetical protein